MKHHKSIRKFGRTKDQRKALLRSLAVSLVIREKIKTTEAKAKELRPFAERLVTYAKKNTLASKRAIAGHVGARPMQKLVNEIAPKYEKRSGGYLRIIKVPSSRTDASPMAYIEFV